MNGFSPWSTIVMRAITMAVVLVSQISVYCQYPPIKSDIFFKNYTEDDGLPNPTVNCFEEDSNGFIWIGTLDGLSKFNGTEFLHFHDNSDSTSMHNDEVNEILHLDNQLWIGTAKGLILMDIESETFTAYDLPQKEKYSNTIESLVKIDDTLWIGYEANGSLSGALALFSLTDRKFIRVSSDPGQLDNVHDVYHDPLDQDKVWIASSDLYVTDLSLTQIQSIPLPFEQSPTRRGATQILRLDEDHISIATTRGLHTYDSQQQKWSEKITYNHGESQSVFSPNYIKSMVKQDDTTILLNTYDLGLIIYNYKEGTYSRFQVTPNNPFSIPSYRSHTSYIDSKKRIWHGFYTGMNIVLRESQIVSLTDIDISGETSIPLVTDSGYEVMIDGRHYNLSSSTKKLSRITSPFLENWLYAQADQHGNHYYLFSDALFRTSKGSNAFTKVMDKSLITSGEENRRWFKFFSIDKDQRVWVTTELGYVARYTSPSKKELLVIKDDKIGICQSTPEASYRVAHGDNETIISHACGLLIYDDDTEMLVDINDHYQQPIWDASLWTYGISYIGENTYVVGTFREGFYKLSLAQRSSQSISPQLENIIISNITSNHNGEAWCATDAGIIYYNADKDYNTLITKKEGLPQEYLIFQNPYFSTNGDINMMIDGKIIGIDNDKLIPSGVTDQAIVTSVHANNRLLYTNMYLSHEDDITLDHNQNDLEISYSHITNFKNEPVSYFYKMIGLNDQWVDAKSTSTARFFGLDPGNYEFQLVRATSSKDQKNMVRIPIKIDPPIWATWWFRILSLLTILTTTYWMYNNRISSIKNKLLLQQEEQQNTILKEQNDIIQTQNKELVRLNQSKDKFFSVLAHDLRSPLAAFSGLGKQLNYHIERKNLKKVNMLSEHIQESAESLTTLVDNLLNWSLVQTGKIQYEPEDLSLGEIVASIKGQLKDVLIDKDIEIETCITPHAIMYADNQAVHIILRNIISNAIKFSHSSSIINIHGKVEEQKIQVIIKDQGVGISQERLELVKSNDALSSLGTEGEKGIGLGIALCKELLEMNKATFDIDSVEEKGTCVTLFFPKSNHA